MEVKFVGRKAEFNALQGYIDSDKSEFVAVYGRRRVGKTFLIRKVANDEFAFFMTGAHDASRAEQLCNFSMRLRKYSKKEGLVTPENWIQAFYQLSEYLESLPQGKKIIFIDELPWFDTAKSGFISGLENFWNSWAVLRDDIKLIVCGSATSWMMSNLIGNRGGLHNRLTHHIYLEQFTLAEAEEYFQAYNFGYSRKQIAQCYMIMGGIPYYFSQMESSKSLAANIDELFFANQAKLKDEFRYLYNALFKKAEPHIAVVSALAKKGIGMSRKELNEGSGLSNNGAFSTVLEELEQCGFIRQYLPFENKYKINDHREKKNAVYQLVDFYTIFYFNFIRGNTYQDEHFWTNSLLSSTTSAWSGIAFEQLCLSHIKQIKQALGIFGVQARVCSWRAKADTKGCQIDLLIDRKDDTINLCEMKFYSNEFEISAAQEEALLNKCIVFREQTGTKKSILLTLITTFGIKPNSHSDIVQCSLTLDDLFCTISGKF